MPIVKADELQLLKLINRRIERLLEEYSLGAPSIVKNVELNLIIDASKKLLAL